jgi:hypothetical protein
MIDPDIDPALYTPSKCMRLLNSALASTSSGSYLVTKTPLTAAQASYLVAPPVIEKPPPLPEPDWTLLEPIEESHRHTHEHLENRIQQLTESLGHAQQQIHARNLVIEANQAQLIVQGLTLTKMKESLEAKEKPKKTDNSVLFPGGNGLVLTSDEFVERMEERKRNRAEEEQNRKQRQVARAGKKAAKKRVDDQWRQIKEAHERAIERWLADCEQLTVNGTLKRDLPKCPARPLKPKPSALATSSRVQLEDLDQQSDQDEGDCDDVGGDGDEFDME